MRTLILLTLLSLSLFSANATLGVDVSAAVSTSSWECIHRSGYDFAVVRVYCSYGGLDPNGAQTIKNARAAGMPDVDGYIFPCVSCGNPAGQVSAAVNHLRSAGAKFGMIWYDIEVYAWSGDKAANQNFIIGLIEEGKRLGVKAGIYSSYYNWESIVGLGWSYPKDQGLPIWYAHYDYSASYSDWSSFGGWRSPSIKQFDGSGSVCGVGIDKDFY